MDFRKFLKSPGAATGGAAAGRPGAGAGEEEQVLPYFGGLQVDSRERRLRLRLDGGERPRPGFYRFAVSGRSATLRGPAEAPPLEDLPAVRGHLLGARLVLPSGAVEPLFCLPEEVPPRCAPIIARRWPTGELLFDQLEFEGDAEEAVRRALQDEQPLARRKGVPASLRAAFAYTVGERLAQRLAIPVSPLELLPYIAAIAERGGAAAAEALVALQDERRAYVRRREQELLAAAAAAQGAAREQQRAAAQAAAAAQSADSRRATGRSPPGRDRRPAPLVAEERAEAALHAAGATLLDTRALGRDQLEVTYRFYGQRFISIVQASTLQVLDAGVCLAGADSLVTLESLPSVLKEAIETRRLVITRRAPGDSTYEDYDD